MIHNVDTGHGCSEGKTRVNIKRPSGEIETYENHPSLKVSDALSGAIRQIVKQGMAIDPRKIASARQAIEDGEYPVGMEDPELKPDYRRRSYHRTSW